MNRFLEYTTNHPFLVAAAAILAVIAIVIELRARARGSTSVSANDAILLANSGALLLDVRDAKDYEAGHIIDARNIPAAEVASRAESLKKFKEKPVIVYCDGGFTSAGAARALRASGFTKVVTLNGGLNSWRQENLPLVKGAPVKKDGKHS
jgi:rhodanese-related sulfurtransferase